METEQPLRLCDVFVSIHDPRQPGKVKHYFVEWLIVAVNGVLVGADTFSRSWPNPSRISGPVSSPLRRPRRRTASLKA